MSAGLMPGAEWLPLLAELAAKATLILLLAAAVSALLWRASAAVRHLVWCVAVIGVLALPVFSVVLPAWEVPLLPSTAAPASTAPATLVEQPGFHAEMPDRALLAEPMPVVHSAADAWLPRAAAGLVAAGVLAGLLWLALGFWGVARMGRRAQVVHDPEWLRSAHEAAEQLQLRRPVLLLRDRGAVMPATGGLLWPAVVLPANADQWADDRRRAVLAHELAHVKRFDTLTQALAQVACALFWWHPAVWYAARRLRVERERACDDLVLRTGTRASDYASHLLEIARSHRSPWLASPALVSMARPSQLESRLLWVLDAARSRGVPSAGAKLLAVVAGLLIVGSLAAMRPVEAAAAHQSGSLVNDARAEIEEDDGFQSGRSDDARSKDTRKDAPKKGPASALAQTDTPPARAEIDDLVAMRAVGVDAEYIGQMRDAGYTGLSSDDLVSMRAVGVTPEYAREMNGVGWGRLTADELTGLRAVGVTAAWLVDMRRAGVDPRSADEATGMRAVGVDAQFVAQMRELGFTNASASDLTGMRAVGVTREFVRELVREGVRDVSANDATSLRALRVDADYLADLRAAGLSGLDVETLSGLRAVGVTGAYIRELASVGLTGLSARRLTDLRAHRIDAAYVRELREAGFADLNADQLIRLRASGVDRDQARGRARTP
ncbi:M56 family metallopeptidase [Longimicrobium sp.]|jgi:beta-lactamase regulating signal transducer with metallopeptidase domain|uniref:M56 family metallopeptidase n=1 Tax=Longimicrobium sp. TaxID=2029185 RepID=UPI002EDA49FA